ncbi:MAG: histidinol-phosphatase [Verrucomicrobiales bacterium]|nr:histidinol-phosphatase [Verrucomicrobiales bacterium]
MAQSTPLFFDSHMHTPLCKHAVGHPVEYMEQGVERGLAGIIMTCHSPMPNQFSHRVRMSPEQFDEYVALVGSADDASPDGFEVRLGMESDYFPGMEEWLSELHARADFHYILGSVHWHIPEYVETFWRGDAHAFRRQYFEHLAESAESGLFDALSHPDLIKNASPEDWQFSSVRGIVEVALDRIAKTGVAMEINTSGKNKAMPEMNPGPEMLALMAERDIPIVLGSDSHTPKRVADGFHEALNLLEAAGYDTVSVFRKRKRMDYPLELVRSSLPQRREAEQNIC